MEDTTSPCVNTLAFKSHVCMVSGESVAEEMFVGYQRQCQCKHQQTPMPTQTPMPPKAEANAASFVCMLLSLQCSENSPSLCCVTMLNSPQ
jgi:hypothetical protein